jgi:hypothetical protein
MIEVLESQQGGGSIAHEHAGRKMAKAYSGDLSTCFHVLPPVAPTGVAMSPRTSNRDCFEITGKIGFHRVARCSAGPTSWGSSVVLRPHLLMNLQSELNGLRAPMVIREPRVA